MTARVEISAERIRAAALGAPAVADAIAVFDDAARSPRWVLYVVPRERRAAREADPRRVGATWASVFDAAYAAGPEPSEDFTEWVSSYSGDRLPQAEMREWLDATVARVPDVRGRAVLEVGCGDGKLAARLAPSSRRYVGIDSSREAVRLARARLAGTPHVEVHERPAEELRDAAADTFDVVVMNSVVQYLASAEQLGGVLDAAFDVLSPTGEMFVGDVRHLGLIEAHHLLAELQRPTDADIAHGLDRRLSRERELLVAPAFFDAFVRAAGVPYTPAISPKQARARNELTLFRYDVALRPASEAEQAVFVHWNEVRTLARLRELAQRERGAFVVEQVENARVAAAVATLRLLDAPAAPAVEDLRAEAGRPRGVDPADAADAAGGARVSWRSGAHDGSFDVVVAAGASAAPTHPRATSAPPEVWTNRIPYASAGLLPELRSHVERTLPPELRPAAYVAVSSVDDPDALPAPEGHRELEYHSRR